MNLDIRVLTLLLYYLKMRHLHHRPLIHLPRPHHIIKHRKKHHAPRHQDTKIHMRGRHRRRDRPKAKKENNNPKHHRKRIHPHPHQPRKPKRAPNQLIRLAAIIRDVRRLANLTRAPAPEEQGFGNDVGSVEAADAEGNDVVEGGGGADVDEADEAGDEGGDEDGEEGDGVFGLDLLLMLLGKERGVDFEQG